MSTQRKIGHVLQSSGDGQSFAYHAALGTPFDLSAPVLVTEKVDGSTMQVLNGAPFKRYDNFKKGDPRKHGASEEERYRLCACSRDNPSERYYLDAFDAYAEQFAMLDPGVWFYFEAMGAKIGARYPGLSPTVRVFDSSRDGAWRPFEDTRVNASAAGLPVVQSFYETFGSIGALLGRLSEAESTDADLPPHKLEGWVLRQGDLVAKIRKADLGRIK